MKFFLSMTRSKIRFKIFLLFLVIISLITGIFKPREIIFLRDFIFIPKELSLSPPLNNQWTRIESLDHDGLNLLLEIEDKNFYNHNGFSPTDIQNSLFDYFFLNKKLRGASTLTQQLSRTLFLNRDKTAKRKLEEIRFALLLERNVSKETILELYLNTVYWGHNLVGINQASRYYYGISPEELNHLQLEILYSILNRPDKYTRENIQQIYNNKLKRESL